MKSYDFICPRCNQRCYINEEDYQYYVTYWGEDNINEYFCEHCDHEFKIKEHVTRIWEVLNEQT